METIDISEAFKYHLTKYGADVSPLDNKINDLVYEYNELTDKGWIRNIAISISIAARFDERKVSTDLAVDFLSSKIHHIFTNYKIFGSMFPGIRVDLAIVSPGRSYVVALWITVTPEAENALRDNRFVCPEGGIPTTISNEEINEFLFNKQFDKDLEGFLK